MNKTELVDALATKADISKVLAAKILEAFTTTIAGALSKGDSVALIGFGTFDVSSRKQRTGRNPQTGKAITIPAAKVPRFRAGKQLKEKVNK
jgi:DNA-binding protein HU-beta